MKNITELRENVKRALFTKQILDQYSIEELTSIYDNMHGFFQALNQKLGKTNVLEIPVKEDTDGKNKQQIKDLLIPYYSMLQNIDLMLEPKNLEKIKGLKYRK